MAKALSVNRTGIAVGLLLSGLHALWSIAVAVAPVAVENFYNWILGLHHIYIPFTIETPFVLMRAVLLVIITLLVGYIVGAVFALIYNPLHKK